MFEPGNSNSDILFKKSLRSGNKSAKLTKKNSQYYDGDMITRQLSQIVFEMQNKNNSFDLAIQLLTEESSILRQHLSFQVFIPEIKTQLGEKLLKDNNLWIIILVVFHCLCKEKSKYSDFVQRNILNTMQKNYQDDYILKSIQQQANQIISKSEEGQQQILNQSASKCSRKQLRVQFQEDKENQQSNSSNHKKFQVLNQIESSKEQENTLSNDKLKKKIDDLTKQFQQLNNDSFENQEIVVPQVEEIINEQVKELEEELKNQHDQSNKKQRLSLTEKLFSRLGFKAWRSEQKQIKPNPIQTKMRGIRLLDGLDSRELQTSYVAKVEKILVPNLNDNGLHSIIQLSLNNSQELLEWGLYATCIYQLNVGCYWFINSQLQFKNFYSKIYIIVKKVIVSYNQVIKITLVKNILKICNIINNWLLLNLDKRNKYIFLLVNMNQKCDFYTQKQRCINIILIFMNALKIQISRRKAK